MNYSRELTAAVERLRDRLSRCRICKTPASVCDATTGDLGAPCCGWCREGVPVHTVSLI